jgi:hypothetical protein
VAWVSRIARLGAEPPDLGFARSLTDHRPETRWPGYCCRGDHMKLDDQNRHCFALSRYERNSGEWTGEKAHVNRIID